MKLEFTAHAVIRMQERKISVEEVEEIIRNPDGTISQSKQKIIFYKKVKWRNNNMIAAVTALKTKSHFTVITVMVNFMVKE
jgi:hypothetical protein